VNTCKDLVQASAVLAHPQFSPEYFANDIAVIKLATDAIFNSYVQPICMWKFDKIHLNEVIGKVGTVVGWGVTEDGRISNALQEASLPVVPALTCLRTNRDLFGRFLNAANFCAGWRNGSFNSK